MPSPNGVEARATKRQWQNKKRANSAPNKQWLKTHTHTHTSTRDTTEQQKANRQADGKSHTNGSSTVRPTHAEPDVVDGAVEPASVASASASRRLCSFVWRAKISSMRLPTSWLVPSMRSRASAACGDSCRGLRLGPRASPSPRRTEETGEALAESVNSLEGGGCGATPLAREPPLAGGAATPMDARGTALRNASAAARFSASKAAFLASAAAWRVASSSFSRRAFSTALRNARFSPSSLAASSLGSDSNHSG